MGHEELASFVSRTRILLTKEGAVTTVKPAEWVSPEELATELGIPVKTIYQWRYRRTGPKAHRIGRHVRFRRRDIETWLSAKQTTAAVVSPDSRSGPPLDKTARKVAATGTAPDVPTVTAGGDDAGQLTRRRDAALRLPSLASGHRDPLDALSGLPIIDRDDCCRGMFDGGGKWQPCCRGAARPRYSAQRSTPSLRPNRCGPQPCRR
jgi:excisionase family DNA binding protein